MDLDQAAAIAAAAPPGVLELGGRSFLLKPMTGPEELAVYEEMRRQVMTSARDPLDVANERIALAEREKRPFSPTVVAAMVQNALAASGRQEAKAEPSQAEVAARMHTLGGSQWLIWFRLRKADPTVTLANVKEWVPDDDAKNDVLHRMAELSGLKEIDPKKA